MYDPDLYRSKEEIDRWRERDPIALFQALLREQGALDDADLDEIERAVADEIDDAVAFAEEAGFEPVEDLERFVYAEEQR
jgi:TPP-dependent pyruvate/acetoin dehydrogenase alpha subunit